MKKLALILTLSIFTASAVHAGKEQTAMQTKEFQNIYRAGSQKTFKGPEEFFTGDVQVDPLFPANDTAHYSDAYVTFQPPGTARR